MGAVMFEAEAKVLREHPTATLSAWGGRWTVWDANDLLLGVGDSEEEAWIDALES